MHPLAPRDFGPVTGHSIVLTLPQAAQFMEIPYGATAPLMQIGIDQLELDHHACYRRIGRLNAAAVHLRSPGEL